jgi:hypothetical protein
MLDALLAEPPFRRVVQLAARLLPCSVRTKDRWSAADRPHYLAGVLYAAEQAKREGHDDISVIEFGVAEGYGLLVLERHAAAVERETGIRIDVYGFDSGEGLPTGTGDYRDHCDWWQPGDYAMSVPTLKAKLRERTRLVLGDVGATIATTTLTAPLGFISFDLDYYSSTVAAMRILAQPRLRRVAMYFDDVAEHYNHRFAGELLAIEEFNAAQVDVRIDRWRGLHTRPFHDAAWVPCMYLAHDLAAISATRLTRPLARMR